MKHLFAVLSVSLVLIGVLTLNAQQYVIERADTLDNGGDDYAQGIAIDTSGNVYVTGISFDSTTNYLTVKYDSLGNILWTATIDNGNDDYARGIAVDNNGNVYVTGVSYIDSTYDYLTIKYDSMGNIVWKDTLDNGSTDKSYGIAVDGSGNVYVTGYSYIGSSYDYLTVKYDVSGNILRVDTLDNGSSDYARGIAVDASGNVYITGYFDNGSNDDYLTVKYDSSWNIVWADTVDNGATDEAYGIAVDKQKNIYVTGKSYIGSDRDYLTLKYDSLGNTVWADTLNDGNRDYAKGIAVDNSGNIYVTGYSYNSSTYDADYLTVKYDASGNPVWSDTLDNGDYDAAYGIAVDNSGNIYVTGQSYIGSNFDYLTVKYAKYKDAGIISILSPDTVGTDSSYIPQIWVKNNSYEDTLSFDISAFIDSSGTKANLYADTQSVSNLPAGDSVLVSFASWTAPSSPLDLNLSFHILTSDVNPANDTLSKVLSVKDMSGILSKEINKRTMLNVATINKGSISFSYGIAKSEDYNIALYSIDGRMMKKIEGKENGYHSGKFSNLPSGIYFIRLKQGDEVVNKKVVLVK